MLYPVTKKVAIFDHKEKNRKGKRYVRNLGSNKVKKVYGQQIQSTVKWF